MSRPRRFDEQLLLDHAQEAFWVNGYDRTTIEVVAAASGVGNGSIYAAYGSKLGLFLAVFARYCAGRVELVDSVVSAHHGDFESAVAHYLDEIVADCTSHADRRGCLMLNSLAELGARFPEVVTIGRSTLTAMEQVVAKRVVQAVDEGEMALTAPEVEPLSAHIVLVSQGLISLSRIGVSADELRGIASTSSRMSALLHTHAA
ncbi:MAG: TetR/AcrR family transcriptional regulator [Herbiconiux sp.]|uniref:TetR/AcrR family transcriptional regulator n=1 Tax=Herbiconiux sp. TaxID=1871186 RepID=UPI00121F7D40|nr:TetR/AcrR family transcriptional regulator [Herbiconiux sp.]TAJ49382.1 MAG: TetR/AcrR family transcriptional regulator [Herbiconiux sp.]